jgi:RNA polymerase sigma-70 factor (ECF subfamily)
LDDFERAYHLHSERVLRLCLRYGAGRLAWAEDVTQDVFMQLLANLPRLSGTDDVEGWLVTVATRLCLKRLKRESSIVGRALLLLSGEPARTEASPDALFELKQDAKDLLAVLHGLPPKERMVMTMLLAEGKSQRDIGEALDLSPGYVSKLVARGRQRLSEAGWEVDDAAS